LTQAYYKSPPRKISFLFVALMAVVVSGLYTIPESSHAQRNPAHYNYPHNHLEWYTIESERFLIHFQEGNSRPAQVASRIAEEVYDPITNLYDHEPDHKVNILIIDRLDYSNGAAFFYDNKIEIWLPSLDTPLRGTHSWLRNVITHEFTHIVQLQASMKQSRRVPATYVQWLSYEDIRRPDVLYGFPNGIISYPLSGISMPGWLAEGTAQFMHSEIFYDYWDSHRDMLLRTRILDDNYLDLETMGTFSSKTSMERELVYNQGFAFTYYLVDRFGQQVVADITRAFRQRGMYDVRKAIQQATGIDGREVFEDWITELKDHYTQMTDELETEPDNRRWIEPVGFFNFHAAYSPDGKNIAYLSNKMTDGSLAALYVVDADTNEQDEGFDARLFEKPSLSHVSKQKHQHDRSPSLAHSTTNHSLQTCNKHSEPLHFDNQKLWRLETSFSYSPDGKQIAYSRAQLNAHGEQYRDLYTYELESDESKRLTHSNRLQDPAWSPGGNFLAAGKIEDGSLNLHFFDLENDTLLRATHFQDGEQIYRPVWHPDGDRLFFAYSDTAHRGIYQISIPNIDQADGITSLYGNQDGNEKDWHESITPVLAGSGVDYRDPVVSKDGQWLYYSADHHGIFNIYRLSLDEGYTEQITNVAGGAFMPYPHPEKQLLLYSEFVSDGYKIAERDLSEQKSTPSRIVDSGYQQNTEHLPYPGTDRPVMSDRLSFSPHAPRMFLNPDNDITNISRLNHFDDSDITSLPETAIAQADTGIYRYDLPTIGTSSDREFYRYEDQFTSFQFFPVIRFDNYSRLHGSNSSLLTSGRFGDLGDNLWRDVKIGAYFASREMRERISIYGGALFGPGSRPSNGISNFFNPGRLVDLDRDLFLQVEYAGLPFIERHWSPTISVSFFNIRRNVSDGLQVEEFPCTSCMPDTTSVDIAYDMWEVQVNAISKINRWSLVELAYYYSPYKVSTDSFFSREFQQEVAGSTSRYYKGSTWSASWMFDLSMPDRHGDIAPLGASSLIRYRYQPSELLDSYDIRDGTLIPVYDQYNNHSFEADLRFGFVVREQRMNLRTRFFSYIDGPDEFFYLDYIGGMIGMRSYPYFALGGTTTAFSQLSWFIPLKTNIYQQMGRVTLDKVFLRMFAEAGNGWGGPLDIDKSLKTGVGAELRVGMNSYYLFPSSFFISAAYGFNSYDLQLPEAFITDTQGGRVAYGNQILINFGLLFDFDF